MQFSANAGLNRTLLFTATAAVLAVTLTGALTPEFARIGSVAGLVILLLGALRLASIQGSRAALLGRFVSPGIAGALDRDGVPADTDRDLSVVYADIRNFTRFTETTESAQVMRFLREYYDAVGAAVAAQGGMVKDYAGDGVLVLVGAIKPLADHADRAVTIANAIREAASEVADRWSTKSSPLGVGIGVASGVTTLGMVGGNVERMEFAAVGPAINLAARLCAQAASREILVAEQTRALTRSEHFARRCPPCRTLALKGIEAPVMCASL